jgi:hypothetical protein
MSATGETGDPVVTGTGAEILVTVVGTAGITAEVVAEEETEDKLLTPKGELGNNLIIKSN